MYPSPFNLTGSLIQSSLAAFSWNSLKLSSGPLGAASISAEPRENAIDAWSLAPVDDVEERVNNYLVASVMGYGRHTCHGRVLLDLAACKAHPDGRDIKFIDWNRHYRAFLLEATTRGSTKPPRPVTPR